jgi:hypothetical protein
VTQGHISRIRRGVVGGRQTTQAANQMLALHEASGAAS